VNKKDYKNGTGGCQICYSPDVLEVHHLDMNPKNNDLSNWEVLYRGCHRMVHGMLKSKSSTSPDFQWCCFCGSFTNSHEDFVDHLRNECSMSDEVSGIGKYAMAAYCYFCGLCQRLDYWLMRRYKLSWDEIRWCLFGTPWSRASFAGPLRTGMGSCWVPEI